MGVSIPCYSMVFPVDGVLPKPKTLTRAQYGALVDTGGKGILWLIAEAAQCPILGADQHTSTFCSDVSQNLRDLIEPVCQHQPRPYVGQQALRLASFQPSQNLWRQRPKFLGQNLRHHAPPLF